MNTVYTITVFFPRSFSSIKLGSDYISGMNRASTSFRSVIDVKAHVIEKNEEYRIRPTC